MKSTKKIVAAILALLMLTSCSLLCVNAATIFGIEFGKKNEDSSLKCIVYATQKGSSVNCVYIPGSSLVSEDGYATITDEKPISIDYDFVYWEDENGNVYYSGEEYYVEGIEYLYAVWEEKTDDDSHVVRVIKAGLEALSKIFSEIRKYITFVEDFSKEYYETKESASV